MTIFPLTKLGDRYDGTSAFDIGRKYLEIRIGLLKIG
jgi:hypothetical protein